MTAHKLNEIESAHNVLKGRRFLSITCPIRRLKALLWKCARAIVRLTLTGFRLRTWADRHLCHAKASGIIASMIVGERIRALRQEKKLSRGDLQERTGLQRTYIWRVENGYTVPAIETLEKFARGLEVPIYKFFYEGNRRPPLAPVNESGNLWGARGEEKKVLGRFRRFLAQMDESERSLLVHLAEEMARRNEGKKKK